MYSIFYEGGASGTGTVSGGITFTAGSWDYQVAFSNLNQNSVTIDMNGTFGGGTRTGSTTLSSTTTPCS